MQKILLALFITILFFSCRTTYKTYDNNHYQNAPLPGIVKLSNGLMMDETEVTNFQWCEYMFWVLRVYGENSVQYQSSLPEKKCWTKLDSSFAIYDDLYLRHPAYRDYPVVGISQKQAEDFAKWRSDRVLEFILISSGIFEYDLNQTEETYFSREKYFAGEYNDIVPDTMHLFYPVYSLPTINDWKEAIRLHDSIAYPEGRGVPKTIVTPFMRSYNIGYYGCKYSEVSNPTLGVYSTYGKNKTIFHLVGNVAEWTQAKDTAIGGSWQSSFAEILYEPAKKTEGSNAWTGFRNVVHWEKWEK